MPQEEETFLDTSEDEEVDSSVIDLRKLVRKRAEKYGIRSHNNAQDKPIKSTELDEHVEPDKSSGKVLLSWQAPEFEKYEKGQGWFLFFGIVVIVLVVVSLLAKAILPAITFILLGALTFVFSKKSPRQISFSIRRDGLLIDNKLYQWTGLASFWIFYKSGEIKILSVRSKKPLMPHIYLSLGGENPAQVRRVVMKYLPEEEQEESVIDGIARRLRF